MVFQESETVDWKAADVQEKKMREKVFTYIQKKYKALPEYPWAKYDSNAVFRHSDNKKWFALVMEVERNRLELSGNESVHVINLKIDDGVFHDVLVGEDGILPAYHMNKEHWISVLLDGTVEEDRVFGLIDVSFLATASKKKKEKTCPPNEKQVRKFHSNSCENSDKGSIF